MKGCRYPIPPLKQKINDVIISDDRDKATIYNKYFHSIFTINDCNNISYLCQSLEYHPDLVDSIDFSVEEVHSELLNLHGDKACGPDHIPVYLLQKGPDFLAPSLTKMLPTFTFNWDSTQRLGYSQ